MPGQSFSSRVMKKSRRLDLGVRRFRTAAENRLPGQSRRPAKFVCQRRSSAHHRVPTGSLKPPGVDYDDRCFTRRLDAVRHIASRPVGSGRRPTPATAFNNTAFADYASRAASSSSPAPTPGEAFGHE